MVSTVLAELLEGDVPEQHQQHGCLVKRLIQAACENAARVFAILAGIAFVCLLGTFVAQVVLAIVSGVSCCTNTPEHQPLHHVSSSDADSIAHTPYLHMKVQRTW